MESVCAIMVMPILMVYAHYKLKFPLPAMLEHSSIHNYKNVFHALMDASAALIVMPALNADLTTLLITGQAYADRSAVMEKDTL